MNLKKDKISARLIEFDIIKCLAIFLVICGHSILHLSSENTYNNSLYIFITSFHMPLFMLIAGFFSVSSLNLSFKDLFKKKFIQLISPCLSFGLVFYLVNVIVLHIQYDNILLYFINTFWFLKSCFLCYFILYLTLKIFKYHRYIGLIIAFIGSQAMPVFKLNWMLPFFITGYILANNYDFLIKYKNFVFIISTIVFSILLMIYDASTMSSLSGIKNEILNGNFQILSKVISLQFYRYFLGLAGSLTIISLIMIIINNFNSSNIIGFFNSYGKDTLGIYIIQTLVLENIMSQFIDISHINIYVFSFLITPLVSFVIMDLCVDILNFIRKNQHLHLFFFGKKGKIFSNKKRLITQN